MSGSETGVMMNSRDGFSMGLQNSPIPSQQQGVQGMRLAYSTDGAAVYKPVAGNPTTYHSSGTGGGGGDSSGGGGNSTMAIVPPPQPQGGLNMNMSGGGGSSGEQMKRKRGRPRKYGPDGTMSMGASPTSPVPLAASQSPGSFTPLQVAPPAVMSGDSVSPNSTKKGRGRPPGPSKKPKLTSFGSVGVGFTPHVITVKAGEDVSSKIMSFSQNGPRAVCILSANGAISNVTLRQPSTSGGTVTYEGRFEILSLSGSFLLTESGGQRSRTGGLSVSLSGPDGRVLGGGVAGILTAATPVQVIVGSFIADGHKEPKPTTPVEPVYAPSKLGQSGGATGTSSPTSHGTLSESSGGPGSPINQSNNSHPPGMSDMSWK